MELNVTKLENFQVVEISGSLKDEEAANFKRKILELFEKGRKEVIIDLSRAMGLTSPAIGALVSIWKTAVDKKGSLYILTNPLQLRTIFEPTNLHTIISIFTSRDELLTHIHEAHPKPLAMKTRERPPYIILDVADSFGIVIESSALDGPLKALFEASHNFIAVNLADVVHANSTALGIFIKWNKKLKENGGNFCLFGLSRDLMYYMELIGLDKAINIHASLDDIPTITRQG
jgi:anti-anti-sigma factor